MQAPDVLDLEARGDTLMSLGDAQAALLAFSQALQLAPEMWRLHAKAGSADIAVSQPDAAVAAFERARAIMPHSPAVLANLDVVLSVLKRYGEAVSVLHEAVALRPGYAIGYSNLDLETAYEDMAGGRIEPPIAPTSGRVI